MKCTTFLLVSFGLLFLFSSCVTERIKNDRAYERVVHNDTLLDKAGKVWEEDHPCVNDTIVQPGDTIIIPGESSTEVIYSGEGYLEIDTTIGNVHLKVDPSGRITVKATTTTPTVIKVPVNHYITDNRRLQLARDSIREKELNIASLNGTILAHEGFIKALEEKIEKLKDEHKDPFKMFGYAFSALFSKWWFWLIVVLVVAFLTRKLWAGAIGGPIGKILTKL
jgi:hypothetical protein